MFYFQMLNTRTMKTIQLLLILALSFAFIQCQKEEEEIITDTPPAELIVPNSPLANLIGRTTQSTTSNDNVLDNTSCFRVQLPVTVVVNGNTITVSNESDYQTVQDAIDAFTTDDDIVNFNYPITIQFQNFSTQLIDNANEFDDVVDECDDDDGFDEIDCITINYPIVINIYNTNNQVANAITITSNSQFFNFITTLASGVNATIVYPISVTNSGGGSIVINSNSELEDFIEDSIDDCDDSNGPSPTFTSIITSGSWYVSYYFEDDDDDTSNYNGYNFTFNTNLSVTVVKNSVTTSGTWLNYLDSGDNKLDLTFSDLNLAELVEDWKIVEYSENQIRLRHLSGGDDDDESYLYLTKN